MTAEELINKKVGYPCPPKAEVRTSDGLHYSDIIELMEACAKEQATKFLEYATTDKWELSYNSKLWRNMKDTDMYERQKLTTEQLYDQWKEEQK